ncbi:MAG TPA: hypothetical protein VGO48_17555 [Conexibacter sp.]|jgi:hypothetical protein|nr:hypothetical protein [Conexibacter sp.]
MVHTDPAARPINASEAARRRQRRKKLTYAGLLLALIAAQGMWFVPGLDLANTLGFEAVLLAVAAVVFAVQHATELGNATDELGSLTVSAGQHATDLQAVADELRSVAKSLPTRVIGVFPLYMGEIAELVGRTRSSLRIICDTPAHAAFSNTADFERYWQNLGRLCFDGGNVAITCAFIDRDGRRLMHDAQIKSDRDDWAAWKDHNRANCEAFQRFAVSLRVRPVKQDKHDPVEAWGAEPEDFVQSMMRINEAVTASLSHRMDIDWLPSEDPLHDGPNIYVWIRDEDQEAVFVIVPVPGVGVRDFAGFHTRAPELIRALNHVFEFQRGRAAPSEPEAVPLSAGPPPALHPHG